MKLVGLIILVAALFSPTQTQAQTQTTVSAFCLNTSNQSLSWMPATGGCPSSTVEVSATGVTTTTKEVCLVQSRVGSLYDVYKADPDNAAATTFNCNKYNDTSVYSLNKKIARASIGGTAPGGTVPPTNNPPTNPKPPTSQTPTTQAQGACPSGTHEEGPLCVPNNPWENSSGIAGQGTIGELATTIISILLYIAGMVAVIMIIIGGYTWMTARGNEAQAVNGRKTTINALIGLIIVILAYAIVQGVTNFIIQGS